MFSEFDDYLKLEFLADHWYDEGTNIASSMLSRFGAKDWKELAEQCPSRAHEWQVRCAEVLDLVNPPVSVDILLGFLASSSDDVVVAAADSLRSKSDIQLTTESIGRLKNLSTQGAAPVKAVLANLLARFGTA